MDKVSISELNPSMKVQCITTKCGFYSDLKLGKWYNVVSITNFGGESYFTLENGKSYDSILFRDIQRFREMRLNKLLS
jgi:hypothetical protein